MQEKEEGVYSKREERRETDWDRDIERQKTEKGETE